MQQYSKWPKIFIGGMAGFGIGFTALLGAVAIYVQCINPLESKYPSRIDPTSLSQIECPPVSSYQLCFKDEVTGKHYGLQLERDSRFGYLERVGQKSETIKNHQSIDWWYAKTKNTTLGNI